MPLFGSQRDFNFLHHINNEYIKKILEYKVGYFKISLQNTSTPNLYGESLSKVYNDPILIDCLIDISPQSTISEAKIPNVTRDAIFSFHKPHLIEINLVPERGDIIMWNNDIYEVYNIIENDLFFGKDPNYSLTDDTTDFGGSVSIQLECVFKNPESVPFKIERI